MQTQPLTALDLFCGCGGFTLGLQRAGFHVLAAIDFNREAVETLTENLIRREHPDFAPVKHALTKDLTKYHPQELASLINTNHVDLIVGGPPCQGFSTARQVDGANHGSRLKFDSRRYLYQEFLRYVDHFQPKIFVMENVPGIRTAGGGHYFTNLQAEARQLGRDNGKPGYRVHSQMEDAWKLGVPQKRKRQLIIGVRNDLKGYFPPDLIPTKNAFPATNLGHAIGDLPKLDAGEGSNESYYDRDVRKRHLQKYASMAENYLYKVLEIDQARLLRNHTARPHNERDLRDFKRLKEGENSATAMRDRQVQFEFPYDKSSFKDRYTRQGNNAPCSTIVAHLSKDGLMFIHPTQDRSLTPREAARIQSFPDWFNFPDSRTHSFRMIGNAVPPLVAQSIADMAANLIKKNQQINFTKNLENTSTLNHINEGKEIINKFYKNSNSFKIDSLNKDKFLKAWLAILFHNRHLTPFNSMDHGTTLNEETEPVASLGSFASGAMPTYKRSGWPKPLEQFGVEAWKRVKNSSLSKEELFTDPHEALYPTRENPGQRTINESGVKP